MIESIAKDRTFGNTGNRGSAPAEVPTESLRDILMGGGSAPYIMPPSQKPPLTPAQRQELLSAAAARIQQEYAKQRVCFVQRPSLTPPPEVISKKVYELLLKKEKALSELWMGGQGSGFLPLIFPIYIGEKLIANWGQAEQDVSKPERPAILNTIRIRRHAALLRNVDFLAAQVASVDDASCETAAKVYITAARNDSNPAREEDMRAWFTELQAHRANLYYMSVEDIETLREQYRHDTTVLIALFAVGTTDTEEVASTGEADIVSNTPKGHTPGSVGTCNAPPAGKSLKIPATPSVINSAWATEFYYEYDMAARNNWFIPPVLLTVECNRSIQVLFEALKHVPSGVPWDTQMDFRTMLRKVIESQKGNTAQTPTRCL